MYSDCLILKFYKKKVELASSCTYNMALFKVTFAPYRFLATTKKMI